MSNLSTSNTDTKGAVTLDERAELLGQRGATIWFTGLSASGKVSPVLEGGAERGVGWGERWG